MKKPVAALISTIVAGAVLAGCGGDDPYCAAIQENRKVLNDFGQTRTDAAFAKYAKAVRSVATTAPDDVTDDWAKLGAVTDGVVKAHKSADISLEDMATPAKVEALGEKDLASLNKAYEKFNDTAKQRKAVVSSAKKDCEITLK